MKSIRQYLLIGLFSTLLLTSLVSFLVSYLATTEEVNELHDAQLVENSRLISGFLNQKINKINLEHINQALMRVSNIHFENAESSNTDGHPYERKVAIQVWDKHGKLLLSTPSAPKHALSPLQKGYYKKKTGRHTSYTKETNSSLPPSVSRLIQVNELPYMQSDIRGADMTKSFRKN